MTMRLDCGEFGVLKLTMVGENRTGSTRVSAVQIPYSPPKQGPLNSERCSKDLVRHLSSGAVNG